MAAQIQDAFIVAAVRTPVGKAPRGVFRSTRPDDLLVHVLRGVIDAVPGLEPAAIEDVLIGCAMPEAAQGLNVARMGALLAGLPDSVPGATVNRFCASGLQTIAMAADRVRLGEADCIIAGGTESMSAIPWMGNKPSFNPAIFAHDEEVGIAFGMGLTAEKVAERWRVAREDQDAFAVQSHQRALHAIETGEFKAEILPYTVQQRAPSADGQTVTVHEQIVDIDEGPRRGTNQEALAKLRPVFAAQGSVTAGNSSQTSDGAGAVVVMSERMIKRLGIQPLARWVAYSVIGVPPQIMGIGPKLAIPRALERAGLSQEQLEWIELNEAFAAQSVAVIRELELDPERVNPLGGAIALGHPLGATGAIRTATLLHGLHRRGLRYGMVTMCVGSGMGAAGIFEAV
ncbi:acetyl-CoA C-acyltransferase [Nitrococcus mobilis]|uniref:acetyl-CoA C-acyltransferase n=1 Tax=Nitrococcus mobilis Nb-231 TaxID=314278 RepID=A4BUW9_9GAMM|nr:acetyl-CoA C-acyltransferase [Nitrococcus mobilis]EAR20483.1 acetyl-CoA acetyltransferase [Nitrococcus mobilis Nb-231]